MTNSLLQILIVFGAAYLIGSTPIAYFVAGLRRVDIFEVGSGNMGATNVVRVMGIGWGIAVWLLDSAKAIIAILLATSVLYPQNPTVATVVAAIGAMVGHNWSIMVAAITGKMRGGKGAATAFGTLIMIVPIQVMAGILVVGGLVLALTRYVSLTVLVMFPVATVWMFVLAAQGKTPELFAAYCLLMVALIFIRFRSNIERLRAGTERRLGESRQ
jgi:glycerol-3-phosphate acyltransferase PlsY